MDGMNKMNKSLTKRLKITRNGKVVRRPMAVGHFRAHKSGNTIRGKRQSRTLNFPMKTLLNY